MRLNEKYIFDELGEDATLICQDSGNIILLDQISLIFLKTILDHNDYYEVLCSLQKKFNVHEKDSIYKTMLNDFFDFFEFLIKNEVLEKNGDES